MPAPRDEIVKFCKTMLPQPSNDMTGAGYHHWCQTGFDNLAKDYGQGMGTTCGFLPHYLLWRFGCTDSTLVNRSEPQEGFTYRIGENLSIFQPVWGKRPRPAWVASSTKEDPVATKTAPAAPPENLRLMDPMQGPQPGDFIIIRGDNWKDKKTGERTLDSSHIMVFLGQVPGSRTKDSVQWLVAQSGMSSSAPDGRLIQSVTQSVLTGRLRSGGLKEAGREVQGTQFVFIANIRNEEENFPRRVIGYVNLDALSWGPAPAKAFHALVDSRWTLPAENTFGRVEKGFGWYTMDSPGGFVMMSPTYILLHRGHEAYRFERRFSSGMHSLVERGLWSMKGDVVTLTWADSRETMSWSVATSWVPKEQTIGTPLTGNSGKLTRVAGVPRGKLPETIPANWMVG